MHTLHPTEDDLGLRLDVFVSKHLDIITRSQATKLCQIGNVSVNGTSEKGSYRIKVGDTVNLELPQAINAPRLEVPVIYEDDNCIVLDKPTGVLTHSKGSFNPEETVATFIDSKIHSNAKSDRAGIVHRLDRATSGVIICAKNDATMRWLQKQFSSRKVKKVYLAVVSGIPKEPEAIIDVPIVRNAKNPKTFIGHPSGKVAQTYYKVIKHDDSFSLVEAAPKTGRTHQLRVHFKHIGHPIVGDTFYGGVDAPRMMLHAHSLELTLPGGKRKVFTSSVPEEFYGYVS